VRAGKEVRHSLGEVPQRLLLHHLAAAAQPLVFRPSGSELSALIQVAGRPATAWTPPRLLLDSQIPHEPGMGAVFPHGCFLCERRHQSVTGHTKKLANATDTLEGVKWCSLPA
jgi:hypothetical protein